MPPKEYKILFLGCGGAGKTYLIVRFVSNRFLQEYNPTIEDSYTKQFVVDGEERTLNILDISGCEEFSAMREQYIRDIQGFIIVYSITDLCSFDVMVSTRERVIKIKGSDDVPIVLVGCECDSINERRVSFDQGEELAQRWGCPFFETSAKENIHVEDVFAEIVRQMDEYEKTHPGTDSDSDSGGGDDDNEEKPKKEKKKKRSFNPFSKYKFMDDI